MSELKAGRELDALIAEKVMGLKPITFRVPMASSTDIPRTEWIKEDEPLGIFGSSTSRDLPPYSTNIAAAWEVVERLTQKGLAFSLGVENGRHLCCFVPVGVETVEGDLIKFVYETAPLAICLAALKVVEK